MFHNYRLSPTFKTDASIKIAQLIDRLEFPFGERNVFSAMALDSYIDWDTRVGYLSIGPKQNAGHQGEYWAHVAAIGPYQVGNLFPDHTFSDIDYVIHFDGRDINDIGRAANDWYWDYSHGAIPPVTALTNNIYAWSQVNPREWETNDEAMPGALEALWEVWTTFVSSFKLVDTRRIVKMPHYWFEPRTYSECMKVRGQFDRMWTMFRSWMVRDIVGLNEDGALNYVIPNLCR